MRLAPPQVADERFEFPPERLYVKRLSPGKPPGSAGGIQPRFLLRRYTHGQHHAAGNPMVAGRDVQTCT